MALNEHVTGATRDGDDVILRTQPTVGEGPRKRVIRDATVEPMEGDFLHFGNIGTRQPDGSVFSGSGYIAMDGNEFPYRRVSHTELVEDW